jgi:hypothetical protein
LEVKEYLYIFFNLDAKWGLVVSVRFRPLYSRERDLCAFLQDEAWAQVPVWTGAENLAPIAFRSPKLPARSEDLHNS